MHSYQQPQQIELTKIALDNCFDSTPESFLCQSIVSDNKQEASSTYSVPDEGFSIKWNELNYTTGKSVSFLSRLFDSSTSKWEQKVILNDSFGEIDSGNITAILGPSGCGKTTLIKALFQLNSIKKHNLNGSIFVNGDKANDSVIFNSENVSRSASNYDSPQSLSSNSDTVISKNRLSPVNRSNSLLLGDRKKKLNICIINQKDNLLQCLTVREDLTFVVRLRLCQLPDSHKTDDSIEKKVYQLADSLQLTKCLDVPIKMISGGEQKRLSVAREIVHRPDVLVLDEPTTGLDSLASLKLIRLLKGLLLTDNKFDGKPPPMAIVLIVHQPQAELFNLFDRVIVMSKCGQTIYNEQSRNVSEILDEIANLTLPNPTYNVASFLVEIGSGEYGVKPINKLVKYFEQRFNSMNHKTTTSKKKGIIGNSEPNKQIKQLHIDECLLKTTTTNDKRTMQTFEHKQLSLLTRRHWLYLTRNKSYCRSRLAFHIAIPLIMWYTFGEVGIPNGCPNYQQEINLLKLLDGMRMGKNGTDNNNETNSIHLLQLEARATIENLMLLSMMIFALSINTLTHTSTLVPLSIDLIRKETQNSLYSLRTYLTAQTIAEFPYETIYPILSVLILYPLTGQLDLGKMNSQNHSEQWILPYTNLVWRLAISCLTMVLINHLMYSLGLLCGAIFINHLQVAQCFALGTALPYLPLSGYIVRAKHWNIFFRWLSYTSPYRHSITSLIVARYGYGQCGPCPLVGMEQNREKMKTHVSITGVTDQVKRLVNYFMADRYEELEMKQSSIINGVNETRKMFNSNTVDLFDTIADRLSLSQTFGVEVKNCDDLRPFLLTTYRIDDQEMHLGLICLLLMVISFRLSVYFVVKLHLNS